LIDNQANQIADMKERRKAREDNFALMEAQSWVSIDIDGRK